MKRRDKGRRILPLAVAFSMMVFAAPGTAFAAEEQGKSAETEALASGKKEIDVSFGFENTVQAGRYSAVHVAISPTLDRETDSIAIRTTDPSGTSILYEQSLHEEEKAQESDSAAGSGEGEAKKTATENGATGESGQTAEIGPGAEEKDDSKQYTFCIPLGIQTSAVQVILRDAQGKILRTEETELPKNRETRQSYVGVFSDRSDQLDWLNGAGVNGGAFYTRTLLLDKNTAPEDPLEYDELDMIVISDYDTASLNPEQIDSIYSFVAEGGILLFGGGENYRATFGPFAERFLSKKTSKAAETRMVNMGPEYARNSPDDSLVELTCADVMLKGGSTLIQGEFFPLLNVASNQNGYVEAAAYSLSDISGFAMENPTFTTNFIDETYGGKWRGIRQNDRINEKTYFEVQDLIGTGDIENLPKGAVYALILALYLAVVGPGVYLFLRAHRRQRFYLAAVATASTLFTIAVYVAGVRTRFTGPFYTYATILDVTGDRQKEATCLNLRSPYPKSFRTVLKDGYLVSPVSFPYDLGKENAIDDPENYNIAVSREEDGTQIRVRGREPFSSSMFYLTKNRVEMPKAAANGETPKAALPEQTAEDAKASYGIQGSTSIMEMKANGTVTNRSEERLTGAAVLTGGKAVLIGDMEPGETVDLTKCTVLNVPIGDYSLAAEGILDALFAGEAGASERVSKLEKVRLLVFYMNQSLLTYGGKGYFVAFPQNSEPEFLDSSIRDVDPDGQRITVAGQTLVTCALDAAESGEDPEAEIYSPALRRIPRVISGDYYTDYNLMNSSQDGPLTLEYAFDSSLAIEKIAFESLSPYFTEQTSKNPADTRLQMFNGNMYFYNYDTGKNDLMETKEVYTAEELAPYLSPANTLTVRYSGGSEVVSYLPVPCAVGKRAAK